MEIVTIVDFIFIQDGLSWILNRFDAYFPIRIIGLGGVIIGSIFRDLPRRQLKKAGFDSFMDTMRLSIVENQQLVKDGYFKHIRHPIYFGETLRDVSFAIMLSSFLGLIFMILGCIFLLFRINIEERMLVEEFGAEYEEYRKTTKKLIPFIY